MALVRPAATGPQYDRKENSMTMPALDALVLLLDDSARLGMVGVQVPAPSREIRVEVAGVGVLRQPSTPAQARKLRAIGVPAMFGQGDKTLRDPLVRDTWQIPTELVRVDWDGQLEDVLTAVRDGLGLPPHAVLCAELHSLLLYEKGQFFLPHQDSEKCDGMLASLVVALPSAHTGGELVVHAHPTSQTYRGSRVEASLVAFYADRPHEVRPVRSGHRITLTYNLILDQPGGGQDDPADADPAGSIATLLTRHFTTPRPNRWGDTGPPTRLVYLLDHQYTVAGLSLRDPTQRTLTWPLVTAGRQHLHHRIDLAQLPVTHQTIRRGRPYSLVLTKTSALFSDEARDRTTAERQLNLLVTQWA